jgi:hypothetical protein
MEVGDEQQLEAGQGEAQDKGEGPGGRNEDDHQLAEEKGDGHEELAGQGGESGGRDEQVQQFDDVLKEGGQHGFVVVGKAPGKRELEFYVCQSLCLKM